MYLINCKLTDWPGTAIHTCTLTVRDKVEKQGYIVVLSVLEIARFVVMRRSAADATMQR